jgi:DivIVA domain-containing protein
MTDDAFRLTPLDVRRYEFGTAMRGYDKVRVDQFREQVADEMERLARQVSDLESRANGFLEQLRAFRERDKALSEALVSAQQLRSQIREQAEREAQLMLREARLQAERERDELRAATQALRAEREQLERQRRGYLLQWRLMAERQVAEATMLLQSGVTMPEAPAPAPAPAPRTDEVDAVERLPSSLAVPPVPAAPVLQVAAAAAPAPAAVEAPASAAPARDVASEEADEPTTDGDWFAPVEDATPASDAAAESVVADAATVDETIREDDRA